MPPWSNNSLKSDTESVFPVFGLDVERPHKKKQVCSMYVDDPKWQNQHQDFCDEIKARLQNNKKKSAIFRKQMSHPDEHYAAAAEPEAASDESSSIFKGSQKFSSSNTSKDRGASGMP